ncbi:MAG: CinA family protein [Candidatus Omnitrophota bacterium]
MVKLEAQVAKILKAKNKTLAVAESCSGGLLSHLLTNIPGSSQYFKAGLVVYSNESKIFFLKIPARLISRYGAVSKPAALKMAKNLRRLAKTDIGISITGIAGPTGGTKNKPVGLMFIALATEKRAFCHKFIFAGKRPNIKLQSCQKALLLIKKIIRYA